MTFTNRSLRSYVSAWRNRAQAFLAALPLGVLPARKIIDHFRKARLVAPHRAQPFHVSSWFDQQTFLQLQKLGIIRDPAPGRYYLDEGSL
jgi:hypothetical protein